MKSQLIVTAFLVVVLVGFSSLLGEKNSVKLESSDKYTVIRVDGRIIFQRTKADMQKGDVFLSGTALSLTSLEARAAVISGIKGRFVLSSSEKGQTKILPAANNISSRSGALINLIDLQNHFTGNF